MLNTILHSLSVLAFVGLAYGQAPGTKLTPLRNKDGMLIGSHIQVENYGISIELIGDPGTLNGTLNIDGKEFPANRIGELDLPENQNGKRVLMGFAPEVEREIARAVNGNNIVTKSPGDSHFMLLFTQKQEVALMVSVPEPLYYVNAKRPVPVPAARPAPAKPAAPVVPPANTSFDDL